jgi:hypothetical protein
MKNENIFSQRHEGTLRGKAEWYDKEWETSPSFFVPSCLCERKKLPPGLTLNIDFFAYDFPMRQPNPDQFTTEDAEDTETKAFLRALRGELISILSSIAASPRQFQKSHRGHRARQVATQRARRPSRHHTFPRVLAFFQPNGPPKTSVPRRCGALCALCDKTNPSKNLLHILPPASIFGCGYAALGNLWTILMVRFLTTNFH